MPHGRGGFQPLDQYVFEETDDGIEDACLALVEQGLLHLGYSESAGFIFWPTLRGIEELGMEPPDVLDLLM